MLELYQPIANFGILIVIAAMYLWQTPRTIEKITKVVEANTEVIRDSKVYHERMEKYLDDMKRDIEDLKCSKDDKEVVEILSRIERKGEDLGK